MTDEQIRIKIAEACGYERRPDGNFRELGHVGSCGIPDYPSDLNACHEMEKTLDDGIQDAGSLRYRYSDYLYRIVPSDQQPCRATARQRCEAFLRTKGLWEDHP